MTLNHLCTLHWSTSRSPKAFYHCFIMFYPHLLGAYFVCFNHMNTPKIWIIWMLLILHIFMLNYFIYSICVGNTAYNSKGCQVPSSASHLGRKSAARLWFAAMARLFRHVARRFSLQHALFLQACSEHLQLNSGFVQGIVSSSILLWHSFSGGLAHSVLSGSRLDTTLTWREGCENESHFDPSSLIWDLAVSLGELIFFCRN